MNHNAGVAGSGLLAPTSNYGLSVIDMFPNTGKQYTIESSIQSRFDRDYLSINSSAFNGAITDSYIEFAIPGTDNEFIDFSTLAAEVKVQILRADGTSLIPACNVTVCDNFFNRMFQSHSVYLNGVQTEGSSHFGLLNTVKSYINMSPNELNTIGGNMMCKSLDTPIVDTVTAAYFTDPPANEARIIASCQDSIHMMGPLQFDMSATDAYLLDNINIRIRLELASPSVVLMSHDAELYTYRVQLCKLWAKKIVPVPAAMVALNKSLVDGALMEYMFDRPIVKTIIFPAQQSSLSIDSPFNGIVPHRIIVFIVDQQSTNGAYNRNPNYLTSNNITNISLDINGNCLSNIKCSFPGASAQAYYQSLASIGFRHSNHLLTKATFDAGRTLFVFDTRASDSEDTLNLEKNANLRFTINCSAASTSNKVVYIIGYTLGIVQINASRRVFPNYLQ